MLLFVSATTKNEEFYTNNQHNNAVNWGFCVSSKNHLYYSDKKGIFRLDKNFKNLKKLSSDYADGLYIYKGKLYYRNNSDDGKLCYIDIDGKNKKTLVDRTIAEFQIFKDIVYFSDFTKDLALYSIGIDGKNLTEISSGEAEHITLNAKYLYFVDWSINGKLTKYDFKSKKIEIVQKETVGTICVDGDNLFYEYNGIYTINDKKKIKLSNIGAYTMNAKNGWIYFITNNEGHLHRMKYDGSELSKLSKEKFILVNIVDNDIIVLRKTLSDDKLYVLKLEKEKSSIVPLN